MGRNLVCVVVGLILLGLTGPVRAQLVAEDDAVSLSPGLQAVRLVEPPASEL